MRAPRGRRPLRVGAAAALLASLFTTNVARASHVFTTDPPGIRTESGSFEASFETELGIESYVPHGGISGLVEADDAFATPTASIDLDIFAGQRVRAAAEFIVDSGWYPEEGNLEARVEQAWVSVQPFAGRPLRLRIGYFLTPFGDYPQRHDTVGDAFLRPPISYDYRTMICAGLAPRTNDGFLSWRDKPETFRGSGAPPVWDAPYQVGAMLSGSAGPIGLRLAVLGSAPSSEPEEWLNVPGGGYPPSIVASVSASLGPAWRLGLSYNSGAYMSEDPLNEPAGFSAADYRQTLIGAGLAYTMGWTTIRAELLHDTWQVPNTLEDPVDVSWYLEAAQKLAVGLTLALRYGEIRFLEMKRSDGGEQPWDYDARRWQAALDWRVSEHLRLQAEYGLTSNDSPYEDDGSLLAFRATFEL